MGYEKKGQENLVCRLLKAIYGLKQAPRQWNIRLDEFMKTHGYSRNVHNPCVYMKKVSNAIFGYIIVVLYVDDMLILAKDRSYIEKCKKQLNSAFNIKDLGTAKRILGMDIHRDLKTCKL